MTMTSLKSRGYDENDETDLLEQLFLFSLDEVLGNTPNGNNNGLGSRNEKKKNVAHDMHSMPGIGASASFDEIRDEQHERDNSSTATHRANPSRPTFADAYNEGMLLEYFVSNASQLDCCTSEDEDCAVEDYETKWEGHQPLTPNNITINHSLSTVSASEQRLRRGRRRRGIM